MPRYRIEIMSLPGWSVPLSIKWCYFCFSEALHLWTRKEATESPNFWLRRRCGGDVSGLTFTWMKKLRFTCWLETEGAEPSSFFHYWCFLFLRASEHAWARAGWEQRERQRAGRGTWWIPGPWDHDPSRRQISNRLSHPGAQNLSSDFTLCHPHIAEAWLP